MLPNKNGFTLIELLVVVAIIGILAAVGVVAYNGYTSAAKSAAAKSNFQLVYKYMINEIQKCTLGDTTVMDGALNCSNYNSSNTKRLSINDIKEKLLTLDYIKKESNIK